MRLNDKHLAAFALGTAPTDKEGYLMKRGEMNKAYQKRWFVLKGNLLFYFEKKGDSDPIGVIILEGCTVELSENSDSYTFELVFQGSGTRTYVLSSETQEEMEAWMKAIACAGYDYMKLMVAELQRQMDDLSGEQCSTGVPPMPPPRAKKRQSAAPAVESGQQLLVDLSVPETSEPDRAHSTRSRVNPFRSGHSEEVDLFGATPFATHWFDDSSAPPKPRSFEQMHHDFGKYIQQKMTESSDLLLN